MQSSNQTARDTHSCLVFAASHLSAPPIQIATVMFESVISARQLVAQRIRAWALNIWNIPGANTQSMLKICALMAQIPARPLPSTTDCSSLLHTQIASLRYGGVPKDTTYRNTRHSPQSSLATKKSWISHACFRFKVHPRAGSFCVCALSKNKATGSDMKSSEVSWLAASADLPPLPVLCHVIQLQGFQTWSARRKSQHRGAWKAAQSCTVHSAQ